ncbi:MAG: PorV/PorQ family protein [Methanosarcinaceae archaeon]
MRKIPLILIIETALILFAPPSYGTNDRGGYPGAFLRIGVGVRPLAMGGAFSAIADDINSAYWNPAGLGQFHSIQVSGMSSTLAFQRQLNYGAIAFPVSKSGTICLDWLNLTIDDFDGRDATGSPTGKFSDSENAFSISYGKSFGSIFYFGGGFRYISQALAHHQATGMGGDVGLLLKIFEPVSLGCTIKNISSKIKWNTESQLVEKIPLTIRSGIAFTPPHLPFIIAVDIEKNETQIAKWCGGLEYWITKGFGVRAGFNGQAMTFGGSLRVSPPNPANTLFDFTYAIFKDNVDHSMTYRVSFLIKFGKGKHTKKNNELIGNKIIRGRIIAIRGDFAVISLGIEDNIGVGDILLIYSKTRKKVIGKAKIKKCKQKKSAIQIISAPNGYSIRKEDIVFKRKNSEL